MRILKRIPVQYGRYDFKDSSENDVIKGFIPKDYKIENWIYCNKPLGALETFNDIPTIDDEGKYATILKFYPKRNVKLLRFDARYDSKAKDIPVYFKNIKDRFEKDTDDSEDHEYTLDELMKIFGKCIIKQRCVLNYESISLNFEKLQAMGLDGVHVVNNNSPLFECWANGSTIWFNTKWIKSIESVDEPHNKIVPWKVEKENG